MPFAHIIAYGTMMLARERAQIGRCAREEIPAIIVHTRGVKGYSL